MPYAELEQPLAALLRDFGPSRTSYHPELPFHHLSTDGLWEIADAAGRYARPLGTAVRRLREAGASGRLLPTFEQALLADPALLSVAM